MAERRVVCGRPVNALALELQDIGANKWFEPNIHVDGFIERAPPRKSSSVDLEFLNKGPSPVRLEVITDYGNYRRCVTESVAALMLKVAWNVLATTIYDKIRLVLTGYGAPLANEDYLLIPLYFGNITHRASMFFKTPRLEANDKTPYEALRDALFASISTLRFVRANTDIPVPHVFMFFTEGPDMLGINRPWVIIERMTGLPLRNQLTDYSLDRVEKIGQQLGTLYSKLIVLDFATIGSLKIRNQGKTIEVGPIASDPNGHPLTLNHYRRSGPLGAANVAHKPYNTIEDYFLNTGNRALLSLLSFLKVTYFPLPLDANHLWNSWQYVHLRHLHVFFTEFRTTHHLTNYNILDTSAFNLDNIHVDDQFNICGIIDWDGINVKPIHLAMQLPAPLESIKSYWTPNSPTNPLCSGKAMVLKRHFEKEVASTLFAADILKLDPTQALDMSPVWESFARAKDYERTLHWFTGIQNQETMEWRAYHDFGDAKWIDEFGWLPDVLRPEARALIKIVRQKWAVVEGAFDVPEIPKSEEVAVRDIRSMRVVQRFVRGQAGRPMVINRSVPVAKMGPAVTRMTPAASSTSATGSTTEVPPVYTPNGIRPCDRNLRHPRRVHWASTPASNRPRSIAAADEFKKKASTVKRAGFSSMVKDTFRKMF